MFSSNRADLSADEFAPTEYLRRRKMSNLSKEWTHLPHGDIESLASNLWRVEGDLPNMDLRRAMTVARLSNGDLVLHSAIAMDDVHMAELEKLGKPAYLVIPNGWHALDAARYQERYPDIKTICPPEAKSMLARKVDRVDGTYSDYATLDEEGTVRLDLFEPERHMEGCMVVRSEDGVTLVFGDSLFNLPHKPGFWWFVYGRLLGSTGGPKVTRISRFVMFLTRSKCYFRDYLQGWAEEGQSTESKGGNKEERKSSTVVVRIVPGHGDVIDKDAPKVLDELASSLMENAVGWYDRQSARLHAAQSA